MGDTSTRLDQIVKGAPPPNVSPSQVAESARKGTNTHTPFNSITAPYLPTPTIGSDPRDALPSSPPQIYLNLLILESSLRLQYLSLRQRLRLHLLLVFALLAWLTTFTYLLFFRPREDGSGVGGSIYWMIESIEKLGWCGGVVTLCLFWGTGMYERSVRWPRKFVGTTNRGLRGFNMKVVVVRSSLLGELASWLAVLDPAGWFREQRVNFQIVPKDIEATAPTTGGAAAKEHWNFHAARHGLIEEDVAHSGDVLKLLLLPKPFSPDFREGWETYRMEYWDRENGRRAELRKVIKTRERELARREGGWLWWTGWRGFHNISLLNTSKSRRQLEKLALKEKPSVERLKDRRRRAEKEGLLRGESHSRSSSRSTTPTPEPPDPMPQMRHQRRGSSSHSPGTGAGGRRKRPTVVGQGSRLSATETIILDGGDGVTKRESRESFKREGTPTRVESPEA